MDYSLIRRNFEQHGFATSFFSTSADAVAYFKQNITNQSIGFGGSMTLEELGLYEELQQNNAVVWHHKKFSMEVRRLANSANIYFTSANAITQSGEIVNIDSAGNRLSMMAFGPQQCYYLIGKNKITKNIEAALTRCKTIAAPQNAQRLGVKTPCAKTGQCCDCNSAQRICRMTLIMERAPKGMVSEIVFIDQLLGL